MKFSNFRTGYWWISEENKTPEIVYISRKYCKAESVPKPLLNIINIKFIGDKEYEGSIENFNYIKFIEPIKNLK